MMGHDCRLGSKGINGLAVSMCVHVASFCRGPEFLMARVEQVMSTCVGEESSCEFRCQCSGSS